MDSNSENCRPPDRRNRGGPSAGGVGTVDEQSALFISRSIIELYGGQMQVNLQEELKQLEISFTLPIEPKKQLGST